MRLLWVKAPKALEGPVVACRRHFFIAAVFSALINVLHLAPTLYMMQVYDRVVPTGGVVTLLWITVIVALAIGTLAALDAMRLRMMMRASLRLNRLMSGPILDRLMSRAKLRNGEASTAQVMREFDTLRQAMGGPAAIALFDVPWTPLYLLVAFIIHPALGVLVLAGGAILITLAVVNERATKALSNASVRAAGAAYATQDAATSKSEVVRALGMRRALVARQLEERKAWLGAATEAQFVGGGYNSLVKFFRMFLQSVALGVGAWLAVEGQISVGAIIAASVLLSRALQPIEQLVGVWPTILQARQALGSLETLFSGTEGDSAGKILLPEPMGFVELDRIVVRNAEGTLLLLKGVSLRMRPGEILGVIGPSGAGKTTLARVVAGALLPDSGDVRIDKASYSDWDSEDLAAHIGYLPQDCTLFPGTIAENICRFSPTLGEDPTIDDAIVRAAQLAGVHELILQLQEGYGAMVGGPSQRLSAGQAQRIALARALYGDPTLLVLDEPNSALDAEGEAALAKAIAAAKAEGAAVLIVAHRAAILSTADRLLVLKEGMVEQDGPAQDVRDELKRRSQPANIVSMWGS